MGAVANKWGSGHAPRVGGAVLYDQTLPRAGGRRVEPVAEGRYPGLVPPLLQGLGVGGCVPAPMLRHH